MKWYSCLLVIIMLFVVGCSSRSYLPPHERVVVEMYAALSAGDHDAYMDTLLPSNRQSPNLMGIMSAISLGLGPVGIDLGSLMQVSIRELNVRTVSISETYALVEARGLVRYPVLGLEYPFCDQHDVRLSNRNWYVDILASERQARVDRILEERLRSLPDMDDSQFSGDLFSQLAGEMERFLNLCE